jgi:hypothetical protein
MKAIKTFSGVLPVLSALPCVVYAHAQGAAAVQEKLESEYKITKPNVEKSDIVTAGSVVVLHKDNLMTIAATTTPNPCMNTYRDGKVSAAMACRIGHTVVKLPGRSHIPHADKAPATRTFVEGETFWVTKIEVRDTTKSLALFSTSSPTP